MNNKAFNERLDAALEQHKQAITNTAGDAFFQEEQISIAKASLIALVDEVKDAIVGSGIDYEKYSQCPACNASMMYQCSCSTAGDYLIKVQLDTAKDIIHGK